MESKSISPIEIASEEGIIVARQKVRELAVNMGFSAVDQTRIATAVSELARNIYQFAGKGMVTIFKPARRTKGDTDCM